DGSMLLTDQRRPDHARYLDSPLITPCLTTYAARSFRQVGQESTLQSLGVVLLHESLLEERLRQRLCCPYVQIYVGRDVVERLAGQRRIQAGEVDHVLDVLLFVGAEVCGRPADPPD